MNRCTKLSIIIFLFNGLFIELNAQSFIGAGISCQWDRIYISQNELSNKTTSLPSPSAFVCLSLQINQKLNLGLQLGDYRVRNLTEVDYSFNDPANHLKTAKLDWHFRYINAYFAYKLITKPRFSISFLGSTGIVGRSMYDYSDRSYGFVDNEYAYWTQSFRYDGYYSTMGIGIRSDLRITKRWSLFLDAVLNGNISQGNLKSNKMTSNTVGVYSSSNQKYKYLVYHTYGQNLRLGLSLNYSFTFSKIFPTGTKNIL